MNFDPYIMAFSAVTVIVTIWMGFQAARNSKTAHDFFVAGRSVSVGWNASAISGEYLSAASFMGIAGMVMSSGYDALWYPVCYACGYLFLLLFIAGPLRRFGAYTIPDFAEGRYDSPLFRKIAVLFVLFIGFFYTMPQMKGAGTTLAYIFPGLPYWAGVVLVGAVITLNVALGGMKGITLVQAFQYWAKMFAISVPVFVLMAVYGHYGQQLAGQAARAASAGPGLSLVYLYAAAGMPEPSWMERWQARAADLKNDLDAAAHLAVGVPTVRGAGAATMSCRDLLINYAEDRRKLLLVEASFTNTWLTTGVSFSYSTNEGSYASSIEQALNRHGIGFIAAGSTLVAVPFPRLTELRVVCDQGGVAALTNQLAASPVVRQPLPEKAPRDDAWLNPFGPLTSKPAKAAGLTAEQARPFSLIYTYSLIIALVCGTAGLPHILVRFYTNPDGAAAKRTTLWVMILIGVFYMFPPIFGVMGRNLLPELYTGAGARGTDKIVLELPRLLNERHAPLGSVLSGITCAGAFAAFMSTFSGLLVSMTGALAHDVYGRMLRPRSTPAQRLRMFRWCAILLGACAIVGGMQVEPLQINYMVGQAFAIAAASYFPLLFMSTWWRGMTMKGAAAGMLAGGVMAVTAISLTSFSDLKWLNLASFWAAHPLWRTLCEQPAIWAVPLAVGTMVVVSRWTAREIPADIRMKMLVLHAPEKLGLKQEYIQEHAGH